MMKSNKAITPLVAIIIAVVLIVALVGVIYLVGSTPETPQSDVTVYINTVKQDVNLTAPQTLDWTNPQPGYVYTKNFTVSNTGTQNLTILLLTTEPAGTTQTWAHNGTVLGPNTYAASDLTLTMSLNPVQGAYTWKLLATNSTSNPIATPTPEATATPTPTAVPDYMLTLDLSDSGLYRVNLTIGTNKITLTQDSEPQTYSFKSGSTIKLETSVTDGYIFNTYKISDGTFNSDNPATFTNVKADLTITPITLTE